VDIKSKIADLQCFLTVIDTGSFSSAAALLDMQVAKVSRGISRLESSLNVTLFNRTTRRIELTAEGRTFASYARESLNILAQGEDELISLQGTPKGNLRIDAVSPFLFHQIVPHIQAFQAHYPDINLSLISNENIIDLIEKKTDIAIRVGQLSDSNLHAKKLGLSKLHIVASPEYLAKNGVPKHIGELTEHQLIGFADNPKLNQWYVGDNTPMVPDICASNGETLRQLALNGNGIALLSHFMIKQDLQQGQLVEVLAGSVQSPNPREEVNAVYYKHSAISSRISAFLDFFAARINL